MLKRPIAISLSPNTEVDDVAETIKIMIKPWLWKKGEATNMVEKWFRDYFGSNTAVSFNSGRSALYALLKAFDIGPGDEVLLQSFTCVAVADPIIWSGAKPIYIDVDESLNINPELLEGHITPKTKAIIVQHTFGIPANLVKITEIVQKHNIRLIEDCAHSLGGRYRGMKLGLYGDAAFFSFGRDKVLSSVFGGMAIIKSKFKIQNARLKHLQKNLEYPDYLWILQQLLHPITFFFILPFYNLIVGKVILYLLIKFKLLSKPVYREEFSGLRPKVFPLKYPNALAVILLNQLKKLEDYNLKRRQTAEYYYKNLIKNKYIVLPPKIAGSIFLRFNLLVRNSADLLKTAKKEKMILGNWYHKIIDPEGVETEKIGYKAGSCPKAERFAEQSLNLPTYPGLRGNDRERIVNFIKLNVKD